MSAGIQNTVSYVLGLMGVSIVDTEFAPGSEASDLQFQESLRARSEPAASGEIREPWIIIRMESGPDSAKSAVL